MKPFFAMRCEKAGTKPWLQVIIFLTFVNVFWAAHNYLSNKFHTYINETDQISIHLIRFINRIYVLALHKIWQLAIVRWVYYSISELINYLLPPLRLPSDKYMDRRQAMPGKYPYHVPRNFLHQLI